jgi:hypothetical protein
VLILPEIQQQREKVSENPIFKNSVEDSKLEDILEKGKKLKNRLQKFSGGNLTAAILEEISKEDTSRNDFYSPLERIGKNDGKKMIPEIESLKLQYLKIT